MGAILTFEQLKSVTSAFDGFTTIRDSDLPDYYKEVFPHFCKCGAEIIMTANTEEQSGYTQLQCCNPDCWIKMAHRFAYFAQSLGYKGFGETGAMKLYSALHNQFKYPTFLSIFDVPTVDILAINGDAYASSLESFKQDLKENRFQFVDAIAALGIPDIGKRSPLFDYVKDPVVLLDFIRRKKLDELCDIVGINSPRTRYFLRMSQVDIITLMCDVMPHIVSTPKNEIYVAITGSVSLNGKPVTRAEFIWECESILDKNGQQMYKLVETKSASKLDYVIADAPSNSSKYRLGQQLNKLITAEEFYQMLKKAAEESAGVDEQGTGT